MEPKEETKLLPCPNPQSPRTVEDGKVSIDIQAIKKAPASAPTPTNSPPSSKETRMNNVSVSRELLDRLRHIQRMIDRKFEGDALNAVDTLIEDIEEGAFMNHISAALEDALLDSLNDQRKETAENIIRVVGYAKPSEIADGTTLARVASLVHDAQEQVLLAQPSEQPAHDDECPSVESWSMACNCPASAKQPARETYSDGSDKELCDDFHANPYKAEQPGDVLPNGPIPNDPNDPLLPYKCGVTPASEENLRRLRAVGEAAVAAYRKTLAPPANDAQGEAVAWRVKRPTHRNWTYHSAHAVMLDELVAEGYIAEPLYLAPANDEAVRLLDAALEKIEMLSVVPRDKSNTTALFEARRIARDARTAFLASQQEEKGE